MADQSTPPGNPSHAEQDALFSKIWRESNERDLWDAERALQGVKFAERGIAKEDAQQFDAHALTTLNKLKELLRGGIDPSRQFHSEQLDTTTHNQGHKLLKDTFSFVALGHPGKPMTGSGIAAVVLDDLHAPNIKEFQQAFPGVKFVAAKDIAATLHKVAIPGGGPVDYAGAAKPAASAPQVSQPVSQPTPPIPQSQPTPQPSANISGLLDSLDPTSAPGATWVVGASGKPTSVPVAPKEPPKPSEQASATDSLHAVLHSLGHFDAEMARLASAFGGVIQLGESIRGLEKAITYKGDKKQSTPSNPTVTPAGVPAPPPPVVTSGQANSSATAVQSSGPPAAPSVPPVTLGQPSAPAPTAQTTTSAPADFKLGGSPGQVAERNDRQSVPSAAHGVLSALGRFDSEIAGLARMLTNIGTLGESLDKFGQAVRGWGKGEAATPTKAPTIAPPFTVKQSPKKPTPVSTGASTPAVAAPPAVAQPPASVAEKKTQILPPLPPAAKATPETHPASPFPLSMRKGWAPPVVKSAPAPGAPAPVAMPPIPQPPAAPAATVTVPPTPPAPAAQVPTPTSRNDRAGQDMKAAFGTMKVAMRDSFVKQMWERVSAGKPPIVKAPLENKIWSEYAAGRVKSEEDVGKINDAYDEFLKHQKAKQQAATLPPTQPSVASVPKVSAPSVPSAPPVLAHEPARVPLQPPQPATTAQQAGLAPASVPGASQGQQTASPLPPYQSPTVSASPPMTPQSVFAAMTKRPAVKTAVQPPDSRVPGMPQPPPLQQAKLPKGSAAGRATPEIRALSASAKVPAPLRLLPGQPRQKGVTVTPAKSKQKAIPPAPKPTGEAVFRGPANWQTLERAVGGERRLDKSRSYRKGQFLPRAGIVQSPGETPHHILRPKSARLAPATPSPELREMLEKKGVSVPRGPIAGGSPHQVPQLGGEAGLSGTPGSSLGVPAAPPGSPSSGDANAQMLVTLQELLREIKALRAAQEKEGQGEEMELVENDGPKKKSESGESKSMWKGATNDSRDSKHTPAKEEKTETLADSMSKLKDIAALFL